MNDAEWLKETIAPKSDQLNADDLITGPMTVTVKGWKRGNEQTQPIDVQLAECKPYRPCKSMRRVLVSMWGADPNAWIGRKMTLFCEPSVMFGGIKVGGIRISHMTDISERGADLQLTATRGKRAPFRVELLKTSTAPRKAPTGQQTEAAKLRESILMAEPDRTKRVDQYADWGIADPRNDAEFTPEKVELMLAWIEEKNASKFDGGNQ